MVLFPFGFEIGEITRTHNHPKKGGGNQDYYKILSRIGHGPVTALLSDGHGKNGEKYSRYVINDIEKRLNSIEGNYDENLLKELFTKSNESLSTEKKNFFLIIK
jgi:hypothetical protein